LRRTFQASYKSIDVSRNLHTNSEFPVTTYC